MSITHTTELQDSTSPVDYLVGCRFCCAPWKQKANTLSCDAKQLPQVLEGHACSHKATKLMPGHVYGKKLWSSLNRIVGSEVGCQSCSFTPLPLAEGSLGKRVGGNKEWTEPCPWQTVGHHNPDHSQPWDTIHLKKLRRRHRGRREKSKKSKQIGKAYQNK